MKLFKSKQVVMATSLLIGVLMLSIPTFAQINQKTGYDKFKDSIKTTAGTVCSKSDSFTAEFSVTVKDNDKPILKTSTVSKVDNKNNAQENSETSIVGDSEEKNYYYRDSKRSIMLNNKSSNYYVTEFTNPIENNMKSRNPFDDENAVDIEKIIDAAVAGLKDNVVSEVKTDGSLAFSGNITDNQVPAIINTVSSYIFKTKFNNGRNYEMSKNSDFPVLTKDIYIKSVSGKANADKKGILENVFATFVMSGKDKDGANHDLSVDVLVNISDLNKTAVNAPDLNGKNVQKSVARGNQILDSKMYAGQYKQDIIIVNDGKFVKIGERTVTVAHADSDMLEGRYHEEYIKEYTDKYNNLDFTFAAKQDNKNDNKRQFIIEDSNGKSVGSIYLNDSSSLNFHSVESEKNSSDIIYNGQFTRIFN